MANLDARLAKLEAASDAVLKKHSHTILVTSGGQDEEEVKAEVERVCQEHGIHDATDSMLIILRALVKAGENGPEHADRPITVTQIDGKWLC